MPSLISDKNRSRDPWILAAIMLLAAIIRFVGLTRDSLWTDETFSGFASQLPSFGAVVKYIAGDVHPPGYFLGLWGWTQLFGHSDFTVRAFSALAGILLIPVVFRLGKQLYDPSTGLLAAFFTAFLIQGVYYSQEVRAYIWMALISALTVSLLLDFVKARDAKEKGALKWLAGVVLLGALNAYFHYFGLLFSLILFSGLFLCDLRRKNPIWHSVVGGLAVIILFSPWLPIVLRSANKTRWIPKPNLKYVAETANILYGPGFLLVGVAFAVLAAGLIVGLRSKRIILGSREKWLLGWILVPLMISVAVSLIQKPIYTPRNMLLAFAAGALLLARAVTWLSPRPRVQWSVAIGVIVAMYGLHVVKGSGYLLRPVKQQVREAAKYIVDNNHEGLPVIAVGWDSDNFSYYLYDTPQLAHLKRVPEELVTGKGLAEAVPKNRFWIASAGVNINEITDFNKDFVVEDKAEFNLARAYLLRRKTPLSGRE